MMDLESCCFIEERLYLMSRAPAYQRGSQEDQFSFLQLFIYSFAQNYLLCTFVCQLVLRMNKNRQGL